MKSLRIIRITLAAIFLAATVAFFLTANPDSESINLVKAHDNLGWAQGSQIIPSAAALCMGAILFWLCATIFMGRIYCSTVCPIGTISDIFMRLHRELGKLFPKKFILRFRWKDAVSWRYHIMAAYYICLFIGIMAVPFLIEPWNIARNAASNFDNEAVASTWIPLGVNMLTGVGIAGIVTIGAIAVWGFMAGRDFCNIVCPIGQSMAIFDKYTLLHIEFDPDKCISCLRCQEICRCSCIKVTERRIDNSRCVRCLDCVAKCPTGAIRLQPNRNRTATPLAVGKE